MSREDTVAIKEFCFYMEQSQCDLWLKAKQIVQKMLAVSIELPELFKHEIKKNLKKVSNLLMFSYIYSLNIETNYIDLREIYKEIMKVQECEGKVFNWIVRQASTTKQQSIQLILENLTAFAVKHLHLVYGREIRLFLFLFKLFEIKRERDMGIVIRFLENLQQIRMHVQRQIDYTKEAYIIKTICDILQNEQSFDQANMGIIFDETILGPYNHNTIEIFFTFHENYVSSLTVDQVLRIMKGLCQSSLNAHIVRFILRLSSQLASQEEYYKLKIIYEKFIFPSLIRKGKFCKREYVEEGVLDVAEFYLIGFSSHIDVGKAGIQCLLQNVEKISQKYQNRWIQLAYLASNKSHLSSFVDGILSGKNIGFKNNKQPEPKKDAPWKPWDITVRNIRERKSYKYKKSDLKGLKNRSSQCYIISTVQALFRTSILEKLLNLVSRKQRHPAIRQLLKLFALMKDNSGLSEIRVDDLQQSGPKEFAESKHQEDAHQYILALMDQLENEFKEDNTKLLQVFKENFQLKYEIKIKCLECFNQITRYEHTYIHTIPNTEKLKILNREICEDYSCEKCHKKNISKATQILLNKCQILIVHVNRFSAREGVFKKELPSEKIPRKVEDYELVGIVFHIGKNMEYGHYVFNWKKEGKTWVEFNDTQVQEFELDHEDQEFERESKAQKTPYILFYKRIM